MKSIQWILLPMSIIILILTAAGCGNNKKAVPPSENQVPVKVEPVVRKELAVPIHTSGRLYPEAMVKLSFKVGGLIEKINVGEGDLVEKGEVLSALDLSEISAHYRQAKDAFQKARRDLERVKNLYNDRAATLEQKQNVETAFQVAESNLKIAAFNLEHARIKAPARGKILKKMAEVGEMIGVGSPVFLFGSTENQWVVKAGVSEKDILRVALGDRATVRFDPYPGMGFPARVSEISQAVDPASGTFEVELALDRSGSGDLKLVAGFVGKVKIEPAARDSFQVIPVDAVAEGQGDLGVVFTVKEGIARKVNVRVAYIFPGTVALYSGLEDVDNVVTSGAAYLRDGSPVKVVR